MAGSMRQRGKGKWELRVYVDVDPETTKERWATRTVQGTKRAAQRALSELVAETVVAGRARSTIAALLEQWFSASSPTWSASTVRQVRSVLNHHLIPALGAVKVGELTAVQIDVFYIVNAAVLQLLRGIYAAAGGGTAEDWAGVDQHMADEGHSAVLSHPDRVYANPPA